MYYNEDPNVLEWARKNWMEASDVEKKHWEFVFPELKESEDERIRKEIVKYLTNELNNVEQLTPRTNEYERWITWLSLKFRVGDTISFKSKQYTIVGIDFDNHCYDLNDDECVDFDTAYYQFTLEKQKEQKPEHFEL